MGKASIRVAGVTIAKIVFNLNVVGSPAIRKKKIVGFWDDVTTYLKKIASEVVRIFFFCLLYLSRKQKRKIVWIVCVCVWVGTGGKNRNAREASAKASRSHFKHLFCELHLCQLFAREFGFQKKKKSLCSLFFFFLGIKFGYTHLRLRER